MSNRPGSLAAANAITTSSVLTPAVRYRLVGHIEGWRHRVAADIVADQCHSRSVADVRIHYLRDLEDALLRLLPHESSTRRKSWAREATRAVHEPGQQHRPDVCRICALLEYALEHPNDGAPAALSRPAGGPPTLSFRDDQAQERLPRLRGTFARGAAQARAHGLSEEQRRARRVLDSTEERLVRHHLDLVVARVGDWERAEQAWLNDPRRLHADCGHC